MTILVNIDNGGTFTDVCITDGIKVVHAKSPTTPHDLTQCFLDCLSRGSRELFGEEDSARLIREAECIRYSTTSGTNAVVERKGTPVALIVDAGQEDSVYGAIERLRNNALWEAMVPIKPVGIAVSGDGKIDEGALTGIVNKLLAQGALRLVIALSSEAAEENMKSALLDRYPRHLLGAIPFLISSELARDTDKARATITSVVNSYLHSNMEHFLYGAESICKEQHLKRPLLIFRNDGHSARVAKTTAIKTWGSGPRGGLEGAVAYATHYNLDSVVAMDVGGTTTDISVVNDKKVKLRAYGAIETTPTSFSLPTIGSFGVGGSSVLRLKDGKIIIGPDSVGAAPGPACYGRGGTEATLTDALLVAGILDSENYLGGQLALDAKRAEVAIQGNIGESLGKSSQSTASLIIQTFEETVGAEVKAAILASGREPKDTTLIAFGGGGPIIAAGIAAAAGIHNVIVPKLSSVFSAFGIGFSHLAHELQAPLELNTVKETLAELSLNAHRDMDGEGVDPEACRYDSYVWSVKDGDAQESPLDESLIKEAVLGDDPKLMVRAIHELPAFNLVPNSVDDYRSIESGNTVTVSVGEEDSAMTLLNDESLTPGAQAKGPLLIRGDYLTCIVKDGWDLKVSGNHDLFMVEGK
jgi:N-methylhydantoinase A/oxoprolinase/acetone carboxylase beta subunit